MQGKGNTVGEEQVRIGQDFVQRHHNEKKLPFGGEKNNDTGQTGVTQPNWDDRRQ